MSTLDGILADKLGFHILEPIAKIINKRRVAPKNKLKEIKSYNNNPEYQEKKK